ncbi:MAG: SGNH/GDSL hydrolase family protein [Candidatus Aminicenantales bacterium]
MTSSITSGVDSVRPRGRWLAIALGALFALISAPSLTAQTETGEPVSFEIKGKTYRVSTRAVPSGSALILQNREGEKTLSPPGRGENLFPVVQTRTDHFFVLWTRYLGPETGLGLYDSRSESGRILPLPGLTFMSSPSLVYAGPEPRGVVFRGNASGNDDLFFLDLWTGRLINLTRTDVSEKGFTVENIPGGILISTATLRERIQFQFDLSTFEFSVRSREARTRGKAPRSVGFGDEDPAVTENTFLAFGDSITWGKMRINGLEGEYHPELAYPAKMILRLGTSYGPAYGVNLGIPGESAYDGALRIDDDLEANPGLYFILMMGTNDCVSGEFSIDSVMEDIEYILDAAVRDRRRIIVSTVPPRKDEFGTSAFVLGNIASLNKRIQETAAARGLGFIDTHKAFKEYYPPAGWKLLLEDVGGNHPNPAGHLLIADMFAGRLEEFPPPVPFAIQRIPAATAIQRTIRWRFCWESDFKSCRIEYGLSPAGLNMVAISASNTFTFEKIPTYRDVYFRIQAVDRDGHSSGFTNVHSTWVRDLSQPPKRGNPGRWRENPPVAFFNPSTPSRNRNDR